MTAHQLVPVFSLQRDIDLTAPHHERSVLKEAGHLNVPSLNDVIVKAVGDSLAAHPRLNWFIDDDGFIQNDDINVGIAVEAGDRLLVPVIRNVDQLTVHEVHRAAQQLTGSARDGRISAADLRGGTFTVSNLGMLGVDAFTALINAPQSGILAVGRLRDDVRLEPTGKWSVRKVVTVTLTADHRVVYGAHAARFLAHLTDLLAGGSRIESPS